MKWKLVGLIFMLAFPSLLARCGETPNTVISPGAGYQRRLGLPAELG